MTDMYDRDPTCVYHKGLGDGRTVSVHQMLLGNWRLCIGPTGEQHYDDGWCYHDLVLVMQAATQWDGEGDPPDGWVRQLSTGRRRTDGDPEQEYIQR